MRQGLALAANGVAALLCSPIAGWLLAAGDDDFKYSIAFAVSEALCLYPTLRADSCGLKGAVTAFGAVTMLGARHFQASQLGTWRV